VKTPVFLTVLGVGVLFAGDTRASADGANHLDLGGAIRFNHGWRDDGTGTDLRPELVRIDAKGAAGPASFSLQYRWYDGFHAVHHAWADWALDQDSGLRVGIQQVPFGLLPTVSHSFWFGSGYYLGIEDDYDLGVAWHGSAGEHAWQLAYFAGDEYGTGSNYDRYSFDVATTDTLPYRERGRLHAHYERSTTTAAGDALAWGVSGFAGHVQDVRSRRHHAHTGMAAHVQWRREALTWQLQWARYRYAVPGDRIAMSAFQAPFEIAAEADVPSLNVAWAAPRTGWFDGITCYNNLSATLPVDDAPTLGKSIQNVTGCSVGKGPMLTYVDWIAGRNMWFAGGDGIGIDAPGAQRWHSRLNVNIGFYF